MAVGKIVKRTLIGLATMFVLGIGTVVAIPFFFKDKVVAEVKKAINERINAKVNFKDVSFSVWKHFPAVSVNLDSLNVVGVNEFEGTKLLGAKTFSITLDFWSVWNGGNPYKVSAIDLDEPFVNIIVLQNGKANYDIAKPTPDSVKTSPDSSKFALNLSSYAIQKGEIRYDNRQMGFLFDSKGLNHKGSGDLATDLYDLTTKTEIDSLTVSYGAITYLSKAHLLLDAIISADMKDMKFTLKDNDLTVNEMQLKTDGYTQLKGDDVNLDFKFNAPQNDFKNFLSLIPHAYTKDFKDVKADGKFKLDGFVKGTYNGVKNQLPAFAVNAMIEKGNFKYPTLPMGVSEIDAKINVGCSGSNFDLLKLDIPKFHVKIGTNPIDGTFALRTPISDPDIDTKVKGTLNLAEFAKAFPVESIKELNGLIVADVTAKTKMSLITQKKYDQVNVAGTAKISNMTVAMQGQPKVQINAANMNFTPNFVGVENFDAKLGKSDLKANGKVDNFMAYFSPEKTMTGNLTFSSNLFDANEWIPNEEAAHPEGKHPNDVAKPFDRFDFQLDGKIDKLLYEKYDITASSAKGHFTPNKMMISSFATKIGNSDVAGSGTIENVFGWLYDGQTLGGEVNLNSNLMDLNQFMTETPKTAAAPAPNVATEPILVPDNMNLAINAKMAKVLYTNMNLTNLNGRLLVKDRQVRIDNATAATMGGNIGLKGGYDTRNAEKPRFDLAYDFKNMDFQQFFTTFNSMEKLAPIGKYISGKFNTDLTMSGELGKDLSPNLNTLSASGVLQTISAIISGFKPLENVGDKLGLKELKTLTVKDTRNFLDIKNGIVTVKEFDQKLKDIDLKIGGTHSLTNEMKYSIKARVPRKLLEANAVGKMAGDGFNALLKEGAKYGVNIKNSEFVNVLFDISGSATSPKVGMKLLGGDGTASLEETAKESVKAVVDKAKDSVATRANEELEKAKDKAKAEADRITAQAQAEAQKKIDEAKAKAVEEAKKRAGEVVGDKVGEKIDKAVDKVGGDKIKKETDKVKDKLDKWDPFKKKKPATDTVPKN